MTIDNRLARTAALIWLAIALAGAWSFFCRIVMGGGLRAFFVAWAGGAGLFLICYLLDRD